MLNYAVVVFAIAAVGGLILASSVLRNRLAPWALSTAHGLLGAVGLILLLVSVVQGSAGARVSAALGLLVVAAMGGFYLASIHARGVIASKAIVVVHAGVAVAGLLTLLSAVLMV